MVLQNVSIITIQSLSDWSRNKFRYLSNLRFIPGRQKKFIVLLQIQLMNTYKV